MIWHHRTEMPGGIEHPGNIGQQRVLNIVWRMAGIGQPPSGIQRAGIADQNIDLLIIQQAVCLGGGGLHRILIAHIHGDDLQLARLRGGKGLQIAGSIRLAAGGNDHIAAGQRLAGHFQPDAAIGAGDQNMLWHRPQAALASGVMIAGSNGLRVKISRSIGSKCASGLVG